MMAVFQSTPPVKAATRKAEGNTVPSLISIHAAREGGDHHRDVARHGDKHFNPRRP